MRPRNCPKGLREECRASHQLGIEIEPGTELRATYTEEAGEKPFGY